MLQIFPLPLPSPLPTSLLPSKTQHPPDFRALLRAHPPAAYTALTTTRAAAALPQLAFHAARLERGVRVLTKLRDPVSAEGLAAVCASAVAALQGEGGGGDGREVELIVVVSDGELGVGGGEGVHLHVYAEWSVPVRDAKPIVVEARGGKRTAATVKNTAWVAQRRALELEREGTVGETVLIGWRGDGCADEDEVARRATGGAVLLEGLVTNFFVVSKGGVVWMAGGEDVLAGSVRALVLAAAARCGVGVEENAPVVERRAEFDAAFLSNAVQIVAPVGAIRFPTIEGCEEELVLPWSEKGKAVVDLLRQEVWRSLDEGSTPLPWVCGI